VLRKKGGSKGWAGGKEERRKGGVQFVSAMERPRCNLIRVGVRGGGGVFTYLYIRDDRPIPTGDGPFQYTVRLTVSVTVPASVGNEEDVIFFLWSTSWLFISYPNAGSVHLHIRPSGIRPHQPHQSHQPRARLRTEMGIPPRPFHMAPLRRPPSPMHITAPR
jgi:hypothetical protein